MNFVPEERANESLKRLSEKRKKRMKEKDKKLFKKLLNSDNLS